MSRDIPRANIATGLLAVGGCRKRTPTIQDQQPKTYYSLSRPGSSYVRLRILPIPHIYLRAKGSKIGGLKYIVSYRRVPILLLIPAVAEPRKGK